MFRSDKSFFDYVKNNKKPILLLSLAAVFLLIICFIPDGGAGAEKSPDEESRLSDIVSKVSGVGRCEVMINYTEDGEVFGVIILCEGAESIVVRERLSDLLSSLYGIGANRISILKIRE